MLDTITQYILALVPAVTALTGMAVMIGVGIGKIKKANKETVDTVTSVGSSLDTIKSQSKFLEAQLVAVQKENAELKKQMTKLMKKVEHIHFVDKEI